MSFNDEHFLLKDRIAQELYHQVAKPLPVIDYHCHLDPKEIADNRGFSNMTELWLAGDHYKWRAMRANGVPEEQITGNASPEEKFRAWAETIEACIGNPLYHWTHLELKKYFGIEEPLSARNWERVWTACNDLLQKPEFTARGLIEQSNVEMIGTTDSPTDTLEYHEQMTAIADFDTKVLPTFRPDEALDFSGDTFVKYVSKLEACTSRKIGSFSDFLKALEDRVDYFHQKGGRISDHGLMRIEYAESSEAEQEILFQKKLEGLQLTAEETLKYKSAVLVALAGFYKKRDWAMQLHFGAIRSNNTLMLGKLGPNAGYDSIYDQAEVAEPLNKLFDALEQRAALPKTIVYNLNPAINDVVATAIGNFQKSGSAKSYIQFGAGWWFNDTKRGMLRQLNALADQGLLMNFIGMLTDSRSFISYTRHEYFRRILCDLIGQWVADGEIPNDPALLETLIEQVCYKNAKAYFNF
ncbi:glucuronate isomerase [Paenibacillus macerans]|uniref:glucuronate isomerase n=1 Tax=Paenibacillus macerans TaxID=44252 RepID=UPI003D318C80